MESYAGIRHTLQLSMVFGSRVCNTSLTVYGFVTAGVYDASETACRFTALLQPLGFVGIIVPHTVRLIVGSSYRRVLPLSILCGAIFLVLADIPSRVLADPAETPIGVVTAFFGAPFFLLLLRVRKNQA
jgi:ABC-type cobalamin transport system permease subunit